MILSKSQKRAYDYFQEEAAKLKLPLEKNESQTMPEDLWRYQYYVDPYLLLETDEYILKRFEDIFVNCVDIGLDGRIIPSPRIDNNKLGEALVHLTQETNCRGLLHGNNISKITKKIGEYYKDGWPIGHKMFESTQENPINSIIKYSKKQFVKEMYEYGRFRISPAEFYADSKHLVAVQDTETKRQYKLRALQEVLNGENHITVKGSNVPIKRGFVELEYPIPNYYLFSTCDRASRRMPTDFDADSALVITDRVRFFEKLQTGFSSIFRHAIFLEGNVEYFDPCRDHPKHHYPESLNTYHMLISMSIDACGGLGIRTRHLNLKPYSLRSDH